MLHVLLFLFAFFSTGSLIVEAGPSRLEENIKLMATPALNTSGKDIIIICSSSPYLSVFWEKRIQTTREYLFHPEAIIICVDEDWASGGAGNGLGTLYAYKKASIKAKTQLGIDLLQEQAQGAAIVMYHTAGQGKRLAPLTISEYGIKSAVELPGMIHPLNDASSNIMLFTLLEATIKQSMVFTPSRKGRLSVFWSDQVFIPSKQCAYNPDSHIDILVKRIPVPSRENWKQQNLDNYGIVAWNASGEAKLFDKCTYDVFQEILSSNKAFSDQGLGISMGTFSLSYEMITALIEEFKDELNAKVQLLDSDPYFWMPMTLDPDTYYAAMRARQVPSDYIHTHYERMQRFKEAFFKRTPQPSLLFFEGVDIGSDSFWWDYGTLDSYYRNNILMLSDGSESELMRMFYNVNSTRSAEEGSLKSLNSTVIGSKIKGGSLKNSLLINVTADNLLVENSILIGCALTSLEAKRALAYYVVDREATVLDSQSVRADVIAQDSLEHIKLYAPIDSDGKANWKKVLPFNIYSWEDATKLVIQNPS